MTASVIKQDRNAKKVIYINTDTYCVSVLK